MSRFWFLLSVLSFQPAAAATAFCQDMRPQPASTVIIPPPNSALDDVRRRALNLVDSDSVPSLIIGVHDEHGIIWKEAIGYSDRIARVPATSKTIYGLGSVSKSMTGTAFMALVEAGAVDLDAPVSTYLGKNTVRVRQGLESDLTVRRLLAMRGGIPHYVRNYWHDEQTTPSLTLDILRSYGNSVEPPGRSYLYSNLAYGIAEQIITSITGHGYAQYMQTQVFAKLGMTGARFRNDVSGSDVARVYHEDKSALPFWFTAPDGAASAQASLDDLIAYARYHLFEAPPVSPVHSVPTDTPSFTYELGWGVLNVGGGHTILLSDGNVFGASSNIQLLPKENAFLIVVSNSSASMAIVQSLAEAIGRAIAPRASERRDRLFASGVWPPPEVREAPFTPTAGQSGTWRGLIQVPGGEIDIVLTIDSSAATHVAIGDGPPVRVGDLVMIGDRLEGNVDTEIPSKDTHNFRHFSRIAISFEENQAAGTLTAWSKHERSYFVLPYYVELTKTR